MGRQVRRSVASGDSPQCRRYRTENRPRWVDAALSAISSKPWSWCENGSSRHPASFRRSSVKRLGKHLPVGRIRVRHESAPCRNGETDAFEGFGRYLQAGPLGSRGQPVVQFAAIARDDGPRTFDAMTVSRVSAKEIPSGSTDAVYDSGWRRRLLLTSPRSP